MRNHLVADEESPEPRWEDQTRSHKHLRSLVSSEVAGHEMMMRQQAGRLRYCFRLTIESKHKVPGNDEMTMQLENLYCFLDQVELTHSCPAVPVRASQILITGNWPCLEQIAGWTLDFKPLCLPTFRQRLIESSSSKHQKQQCA